MAKDKNKAKAKKKDEAKAAAPEASATQRPADSERSFQNVIRNMVVARDGAGRSRG